MNLRALALALLVAAGVASLPVVHAVLSTEGASPVAVLALGGLSMGLPWAGACALEGRRRASSLLLAALGALLLALPLVPPARDALPPAALAWTLATGTLALLGLAAMLRLPTPWVRVGTKDAPVIPE